MSDGDENISTTGMGSSPETDNGLDDLADRLCNELVAHWRLGERVPAGEYLATHPELTRDEDAAFELVYAEFLVRESLGEQSLAHEFIDRFPSSPIVSGASLSSILRFVWVVKKR